jgi:hypothetical protein
LTPSDAIYHPTTTSPYLEEGHINERNNNKEIDNTETISIIILIRKLIQEHISITNLGRIDWGNELNAANEAAEGGALEGRYGMEDCC